MAIFDRLRQTPRPRRAPATGATVVGVLALTIFVEIFRRDVSADLPLHADMTVEAIRSGDWPGNFLFYVLNALFAGFSTDERIVRAASAGILSVAVVAKFAGSFSFLTHELERFGARVRPWVWAVVVSLLMFSFSLPTTTVYIGQLPATVWHNSTTILLTPLALATFALSLAYLRNNERRWLFWAFGGATLTIATKPTFAIALGVTLPLLLALRWTSRRSFRDATLFAMAMATLVLLQYLYIYHSGPEAGDSNSGVAFRPLHVWKFYSESIPLSLAASFLYPAVALCVLRRRLWSYDAFQFSLLLAAVSVAMFALIGETGPREFDGNFVWQAYVAVFLLFLVVTIRWLAVPLASGRQRLESGAIAVAFATHVGGGVWFLYYMFDRGVVI